MADIRITGRMVNFSRLTFDTNDHTAIRQQLSNTLSEGSYLGTLVIIDSTVEQELIALIQLLIDLGLFRIQSVWSRQLKLLRPHQNLYLQHF